MNSKKLINLLNIQYPILQGGMAWVATGELALAVSKAGGLGIIGAGNAPADKIREEVRKVKSADPSLSFGVNLMMLSPFIDDVVEVVLEEGVPIVTTGAGNPGKYMERFSDAGMKVIPVVPSTALAKRMVSQGADAIIVEGNESGGHIGELTTMALVPQVVDAVDVPVIAAGGIGDGRGLVAALSLGASGVQMGTRFIVARECQVHQKYKATLLKAKDRDTVVTARSTGHPVRIIKNKLAKELLKMEANGVTKEEIEEYGVGRLSKAVLEGDVDFGSVMAGQITGMISKEQTAEEIIQEVIREAKKTVRSLSTML